MPLTKEQIDALNAKGATKTLSAKEIDELNRQSDLGQKLQKSTLPGVAEGKPLTLQEMESQNIPNIIDPAITALDYPGRITRTAVAAPLSKQYSIQDVINQAVSNPFSIPEGKKAPSFMEIPLPSSNGKEVLMKNALLGESPEKHPVLGTALEFVGSAALDPTSYSGKVLKAGGKVLSSVSKPVETKLAEMAAERATKSLGRMTPTESVALGQKGRVALGKEMMKEGVVGGFPKSTEKMAAIVASKLDEKGAKIGKVIDSLSEIEGKLKTQGVNLGVDKGAIIKKIKLADDLPNIDPNFQDLRDKILDNFNQIGGDGPMSVKDAQTFKTRVGKQINWKKIKMGEASDRDLVLAKLYDSLNDGVMDTAESLQKYMNTSEGKILIGDAPKLADEIKAARGTYTKLKQAEKTLEKQMARESVNRTVSVSDYIVGGAGGVAAGPKGIALAGLNKVMREYGSQAAVPILMGASKVAPKIGAGIETASKLPPSLLRFLQTLKTENQ